MLLAAVLDRTQSPSNATLPPRFIGRGRALDGEAQEVIWTARLGSGDGEPSQPNGRSLTMAPIPGRRIHMAERQLRHSTLTYHAKGMLTQRRRR